MKKLFLILAFVFLINFVSADIENSHGDAFTDSGNPSSVDGVEIVMNRTVLITTIQYSSGTVAGWCYIYNSSKDHVKNATTIVDHCTINFLAEKGETYYIMAGNDGAQYTREDTTAPATFPYLAPDLNFTDSCFTWGLGGGGGCGGVEIYNIKTINTTDAPNITVTLTEPANDFSTTQTEISFLVNSSSSYFNISNATFNVWYSNGTLFNQTINTTLSSVNSSRLNISDFAVGGYIWNAQVCGKNTTDYLCRWALSNNTFNVGFNLTNIVFNTTTYETESETFQANLTASSTPSSLSFLYAGTSYDATLTSLGGDEYFLTSTIDIPSLNSTNNWSFEWTQGGETTRSANRTQSVTNITFDICNSTLTDAYLNFTFKDETSLASINASVTASTFVYYLGSGLENKTLSFSNITNHSSYGFCFRNATQTLNVNYSISYTLSGYQQRTFTEDIALTNSTTNRTLYLLATGDGLFVTFQVINTAEQTISDVYSSVNRSIGGTSTNVGSGYTGADGSITFWLNPNFPHDFIFRAAGYDEYTTTITPTQSSYTITLGGNTTSPIQDFVKGITYSILPSGNYVLNDTTIPFNFTISTSFWDLDEFGFILRNSTDELGRVNSTSGSGGTVNLAVDTGNDTTIRMDYYWIIDGNYSNSTKIWYVISEEGTGWSLKQLFTDLSTFMTSGMFGLDNFGLAVITFMFIFIFTGILSSKYGLNSPSAISGLIFSLVLFFDVGLGIVPNPIGAVDNFPTILIGIVMVGILIKEGLR